ncbi:hypothetical protein ACQPUZ_10670 [Clostridium tertium]
MRKEITDKEKEEIYMKLMEEYSLDDFNGIVVVGENSEKLEERLRYIVKNNLL